MLELLIDPYVTQREDLEESRMGLAWQVNSIIKGIYIPRFKKLNLSLNRPSVRTERSWRTNQIPRTSLSSFNRNAEAVRLPIRFLVKDPPLPSTGGGEYISSCGGYP